MKKSLGQFFTTNYKYILQNTYIPSNITNIIEPFTGNGDLLNFIENKNIYNIECYDIDPKHEFIIKRDTLKNPPNYDNKFALTNPPYLARNKNEDKTLYDKYNCNDLYKCFILNLIDSNLNGGILIIPLNFISSIRQSDIKLRKRFIEKYEIIHLNIFEEQVFDDTSYTVCCLQFEKRNTSNYDINVSIYPRNIHVNYVLDNTNHFTIGGEIYNLKQGKYKVERATKNTKTMSNISNILLKCIDDDKNNKIMLKIVSDDDRYIDNTPKLSARSYATLVITPSIDIIKQRSLVKKFNDYLDEKRERYNSLFLTNYRESNSIARKRISFELAFNICSHLLEE